MPRRAATGSRRSRQRAPTHGGSTRCDGGLDDIEHLGANEVLLGLHDLHRDQLARQSTADERDTTIGEPGNGVAAGRHLLGTHHDR